MKQPGLVHRSVSLLMALLLLLMTSACGTLLYPDRIGQSGGRIDPAIAILDGVGLLLFLIPGAIAFAVDFTTGAIYLSSSDCHSPPGTPRASVVTIEFSKEQLDITALEQLIRGHTGTCIDLCDSDTQVIQLKGATARQQAEAWILSQPINNLWAATVNKSVVTESPETEYNVYAL